ncbi:5-(carboxyamino)imidazole ribonucleotide synthase [Thalassobaculum salexigens]|uniref:5-(carboxyamino)imidazole ribonucleotide synthase n=1 Tax=Thalassobaculum salexigens TaxID=455360 RepID=UPI00248E5487|nr:5-(carboxyamino)imidazole ribonucleotide synthase [Thalassobaculum salexigens]
MALQPLPANAVIGILGGGQLGRMTALAAAPLGYRCHIYDPDADGGPAAQVSFAATSAAWDDWAALDAFAEAVDVVTYEFENVPVATVEYLMKRVAVRPGPMALEVAQHRVTEKSFARDQGLETAQFWGVTTLDELIDGLSAVGVPAILKTCRLGYDGKGQIRVDMESSLATVWEELGSDDAILERMVPFVTEVSVIAARGADGEIACFPVTENSHEDGILRRSVVPARVSDAVAAAARKAAETLIDGLDIVGLLAVEMFVTEDGEVLINEVAPRPHNSGHWTQNGCATSQFEQFVRAVAGLPLGPTDILCDSEMLNLIGDDVDKVSGYLRDPDAHVHLYGKAEARPGRKMGHVNRRLSPRRG